jgi:hypothetical protein
MLRFDIRSWIERLGRSDAMRAASAMACGALGFYLFCAMSGKTPPLPSNPGALLTGVGVAVVLCWFIWWLIGSPTEVANKHYEAVLAKDLKERGDAASGAQEALKADLQAKLDLATASLQGELAAYKALMAEFARLGLSYSPAEGYRITVDGIEITREVLHAAATVLKKPPTD